MHQNVVDNYWSEFFDQGRDFTLATQQDISRFLLHVNPGAPVTALDIGCGTGQLARELYHRGYKVVGIDFSSSAIKTARSLTVVSPNRLLYLHFDVENDDLRELPGRLYGIITCKLVYAFIRSKPTFLAKVAQLLHPEGLFVIVTPLLEIVSPEKRGIAVGKHDTLGLLHEFFDVTFYLKRDIGYSYARGSSRPGNDEPCQLKYFSDARG